MHKTPEKKMFRKDVQNENFARMEALKKFQKETNIVKKYRKTTGGGPGIPDVPSLNPEFFRNKFIFKFKGDVNII